MGLTCCFFFFKFSPVHILHPSSCFQADNHMLSVTFLRSLWMDRFVFVGGVVCCRRGWANYKVLCHSLKGWDIDSFWIIDNGVRRENCTQTRTYAAGETKTHVVKANVHTRSLALTQARCVHSFAPLPTVS